MPDAAGAGRYLLVESSAMTVALPLTAVVLVRILDDGPPASGDSAPEDSAQAMTIPILDLTYLLSGVHAQRARYRVIVSSAAGPFGLHVEGIRPPRSADQPLPIPRLTGNAARLFMGLIVETSALIPVLNVANLGDDLYQSAAQPVIEAAYV